MKAKYSILNIKSNNILNEIISYSPEMKRILNIIKYNKKIQKRLNINLYNYQKEYLNIFFKFLEPRKYDINHLYNYFKEKNIFKKEKGQEDFIKIINELFPKDEEEEEEEEEEEVDESDLGILNEIKFKKIKEISEFDKIKNSACIQIKKCDLGQISPSIKKLKIVDGKKISMPFSLLNNLEVIILENVASLEVYDVPNKNIKLKKLKYLRLSNSSNINIEFTTPNLIYLSLEFHSEHYEQLEIINDFLSYFKFIPKIPSKLDIYHLCPQLAEISYDDYLDFYFSKYPELKNFYFSLSDTVADDNYRKIYLKFIEQENNIFKCYYNYQNDDEKINKIQSFFYDLSRQMFKVKTIELKIDIQSLEEFLISDEVEKDNYSLQDIEIKDLERYDGDDEKKNFFIFFEKIQKFVFLRKMQIFLLEQNDEFLDCTALEKIIKNLSNLKLLEYIYIKIKTSNIKLSKESLKLFPGMTKEYKDECLILFWKYH